MMCDVPPLPASSARAQALPRPSRRSHPLWPVKAVPVVVLVASNRHFLSLPLPHVTAPKFRVEPGFAPPTKPKPSAAHLALPLGLISADG